MIASIAMVFSAYLVTPAAIAADKAVQPLATVANSVAQINPSSSAQGAWNFVMKTPVGDRKVSFKFIVEGSLLKGTMTDDDGTSEISKGSVEGANLKWSAKVNKPMSMTLDFTGVINGDVIVGSSKGMLGSAKFTAQRN